jgi:pilus assembly protein Flp/PilA
MSNLSNLIYRFHSDEGGATATEYIILLILIACVAIAIVKTFGATIKEKFQNANDGVQSEVNF